MQPYQGVHASKEEKEQEISTKLAQPSRKTLVFKKEDEEEQISTKLAKLSQNVPI